MRRRLRDLGLICLLKKCKIRFPILSDLRIQSWIFLNKRTLTIQFFELLINSCYESTMSGHQKCMPQQQLEHDLVKICCRVYTRDFCLSVAFETISILLLGLPYTESPSHKMQPISSPKGGSWSQAFHAQTAETGDENSLVTEFGVLGRKLWQVSRLIQGAFRKDPAPKLHQGLWKCTPSGPKFYAVSNIPATPIIAPDPADLSPPRHCQKEAGKRNPGD